MAQSELIEKIHQDLQHHKLSKTAVSKMVGEVFSFIQKELENKPSFTVSGFGTWIVRTTKAKKGCDPNTHKPIIIPETKRVRFKPSKKISEKLR